jgi:hypothetical protein
MGPLLESVVESVAMGCQTRLLAQQSQELAAAVVLTMEAMLSHLAAVAAVAMEQLGVMVAPLKCKLQLVQ